MTAELRKLYLECTTTYQCDHHTGIPRVVRNVIRHLRPLAKARGFDVVPVYFAGGALHPAVLTPAGDLASPPKPFGEHMLGTGRGAVRRVARMLPMGGLRDWLVAPSSEPGLARAARRLVSVSGTRIAVRGPQATSVGIQPRRGDVLVLIDVSLGVDMKRTLALFQRAGVTIGALVYDLIPLQHPEWWPGEFSALFGAWLEPVLQYADRIVCISAAVADDLLQHSSSLPAGRVRLGQSVGWFHLGHDLDPIAPEAVIRPELRAVFEEGVPVLLNVGWLDPRKNQLRLFDAFSHLLRMGRPARLLLVGKLGVGGDPILERLARDEELSRHVVVRSDLSDAELDYCFHHARALIYPSLAEGFGLPLVEALSRGLPAFVSDIPSFRELAHDFAVFFDPHDPPAMAQLLDGFLRNGRYDVRRPLAEFRWPTWDQSVADLMDRLLLPAP